jgi:zinc/manganese transport system ATP-binding protein
MGLEADTGGAVSALLPTSADVVLHQLTVAYREHTAVQALYGEFTAGSLTAVVGPNGAGKSSLLAAIMGSLKPAQGEVSFSARAHGRVAWLPQQSTIDRSFPIQTFELVAMGHWAKTSSFRPFDASQRAQVQQALDVVGLSGCARRSIGELSAGQFQRALFARLMLQDAQVILLDEPFSAIDARTTAELLGVVAQWQREARTVIAVLHDLEQARMHFERSLLLARCGVAWGPSAEVLTAANLLRARQLSEAWDVEDREDREDRDDRDDASPSNVNTNTNANTDLVWKRAA